MIAARSIRPEELDRAGEIGAEAFEMDVDDWKRGFHRHCDRFGPDCILVVEHENELVSAMLITPEGLQMGDMIIPGGAVGGVATIVKARRLGCAAAMMRETVSRMAEWGMVGSAMWPFSYAYYRKLGWELGGEVRIVTWPRDIEWRVEPDGEIAKVTAKDTGAIASVWEAVAPLNRCSTVRAADVWAHILRPDGHGGGGPRKSGLVCRRGGTPVGYLLYDIPEAKEGEEPGPLVVNEFRALDGAGAVALIRGLAACTDSPKYRADFSIIDRLRSLAVNARELETEVQCSFGFRIINPGAIIPLMRVEGKAEPAAIRVIDALVGTHTWRATFDGTPAAIVTQTPNVECDIQTFSQIASGYLKPAAAATLGLLTGDACAITRLNAATGHWRPPFRSGMEEG